MELQATAPAAEATPAATQGQPQASSATESPAAQGTSPAEALPPRGADGKFSPRGRQIWRDKASEEPQQAASQQPAPPVPDPQRPATPPNPAKEANFVPQPRFDAVIGERNALKQKVAAYEAEIARRDAEIQRLRAWTPQQPAPQEDELPPEVAAMFGIDQGAKIDPKVVQALQAVPQLQQQMQQFQEQQQLAAAHQELEREASQAEAMLAKQGVSPQLARLAVTEAIQNEIARNPQMAVIDAAALWLQRKIGRAHV